jgi:hypothetical protein
MAVKYSMRIQILTLVDITQTNARRGDDPFEQRQQQNFLTGVQTLSLRNNPTITAEPKQFTEDANKLGFGQRYSGTHEIWKLNISYEQYVENMLEVLKEDFRLVPFISNLNETIKITYSVFDALDEKEKNIILIELNDDV